MKIEKIKEILNDYLNQNKLKIFEISYQSKDKTLSILLDEQLDMDSLEKVSSDISEYLDKYDDEFDDNYILDVSTVGAERPIRNEDELNEAIGKYIYVCNKESEYYGTLKEYKDGIITLEVKNKTRIENISIDYSKVKTVRYAVKF